MFTPKEPLCLISLKKSTPKSAKQEIIEEPGKQRYANLVATILMTKTQGERGSFERLKALVAGIESELRDVEIASNPVLKKFVVRVRNDSIFNKF